MGVGHEPRNRPKITTYLLFIEKFIKIHAPPSMELRSWPNTISKIKDSKKKMLLWVSAMNRYLKMDEPFYLQLNAA